MDNFSRKRRYPINSFIFRVSIHYDDYFPKDKFLSYVADEELINSCTECKVWSVLFFTVFCYTADN